MSIFDFLKKDLEQKIVFLPCGNPGVHKKPKTKNQKPKTKNQKQKTKNRIKISRQANERCTTISWA
jgi:hypothetical protein